MNKYPDYYVEFLQGENMILKAHAKMVWACLDNKKLWRYVGKK